VETPAKMEIDNELLPNDKNETSSMASAEAVKSMDQINNTDTSTVSLTEEPTAVDIETEPSQDGIAKVSYMEKDATHSERPEKRVFNFAVSQYDIVESDLEYLKAHAEYLKSNPHMILTVNGYSDSTGPADKNFILSQKRAEQVAAILVTYGVSNDQIIVHAYGESFPLNDDTNWDENRRVELEYAEDTAADELMASFN
jgi:outer membrane protein OmpA-like peptidoglycan-associated protein